MEILNDPDFESLAKKLEALYAPNARWSSEASSPASSTRSIRIRGRR
jgi:hypothetical protein